MSSVVREGSASLRRIKDAAKTAYRNPKDPDIIGKTVNAAVAFGSQTLTEGVFHLPKNLLVKPVAKKVTEWAKTGAHYALAYTWEGLKHLPVIGIGARTMQKVDDHVASVNHGRSPLPPPLPRTHPER